MMHVGTVAVERVMEQEEPRSRPDSRFPDFDRSVVDQHLPWLAPDFYDPAQDRLVSSFHSRVIRTRHHPFLLDTSASNGRDRSNNPGLHQLDTP